MKGITVRDTDLYHVAADQLGAAQQWWRIALLNGLGDPVLSGEHVLRIPDRDPTAADGLPTWEPRSDLI